MIKRAWVVLFILVFLSALHAGDPTPPHASVTITKFKVLHHKDSGIVEVASGYAKVGLTKQPLVMVMMISCRPLLKMGQV